VSGLFVMAVHDDIDEELHVPAPVPLAPWAKPGTRSPRGFGSPGIVIDDAIRPNMKKL